MDSGGNGSGKGGNGLSWDIWAVGNWEGTPPISTTTSSSSSHHDHHHMLPFSTATATANYTYNGTGGGSFSSGYGGEPHHHLTCLKLGKRPYYEEGHEAAAAGAGMVVGEGMKKERVMVGASSSSSYASAPVSTSSSVPGSATGPVPRCQVEGCNVPLVDAKDYHRRHKVCEAHSKAPKVVVLGLEQRFCQQCSRFHVVSEFDDSKRSCRRRLAGHNERRRKNSNESIIRNPYSVENTLMGGRFPYVPPSTSAGCALSLLSGEASPWVSPDLSYRSSAALRELIAENRAALLARQLFMDRGATGSSQNHASFSHLPHHHQQHLAPPAGPAQVFDGWHHHFHEANSHVTLDLLQVPSSSFEMLSGRSKSKEEEEECCEIWKSLEETHVV